MIRTVISRVRGIKPGGLALMLFFALNILLISPDLMPTLNDLNPNDETKYIDSGRSLVRGYTRGLEWSPLSSFLYAPIYFVVKNSVNWFSWMAAVGRALLFTLLWFSTYVLGRQFRDHAPPWVLPGVMLVSFSLTNILSNPSDALFASMSCLALTTLVAYSREKQISSIWVGSVFMGLAALSRNDGLFLLPVFVGAALYLGWPRESRIVLTAAILTPALALIVGYLARSGLSPGTWSLGTGYRGYTAYTWSLENNFGMTPQEIREQLGTEGNESPSMVQIVMHNPALFLKQIKFNLANLPLGLLDGYGKRIAPPLFYFALLGAYSLWRRRVYLILALLIVWPLHALLYLAFYIRPGFLLLDQFVVLALAAIGAEYLGREVEGTGRRAAVSVPLLLLAAYGLATGRLAFTVAGVVPFMAIWIWWAAGKNGETQVPSASLGLVALFVAALILRDGYSFPNYPPIGETPVDQAVQFLQGSLPQGSRIYAYYPLPALAAKMTHVEWSDLEAPVREEGDFCRALRDQKIRALYITPETIKKQPEIWEAIESVNGSCVQRELVADPGSIQVYMVTE